MTLTADPRRLSEKSTNDQFEPRDVTEAGDAAKAVHLWTAAKWCCGAGHGRPARVMAGRSARRVVAIHDRGAQGEVLGGGGLGGMLSAGRTESAEEGLPGTGAVRQEGQAARRRSVAAGRTKQACGGRPGRLG